MAVLIAFAAGAIKGVVGFAMPTIMISGLASFMSPELALAGLILPTLVTNGMQALRQGVRAAWTSIKKFRVFLSVGLLMLLVSAQLVRVLPIHWLFLGIGIPITVFTASQIAGWRPASILRSTRIEAAVGALAGFVGGLSGVWGPPTVAYLTAIDTPKTEHLRIQGSIYGLGATALFLAHLQSGVIRAETLPLSLGLVLPAVVGLWIGFQVQDRINQELFRKVTLWVLFLAGLNLIRRGMFG
ncbi:MAG: sulfite exporter TauE/SafE family protein [Pseudomonadota bacterium]